MSANVCTTWRRRQNWANSTGESPRFLALLVGSVVPMLTYVDPALPDIPTIRHQQNALYQTALRMASNPYLDLSGEYDFRAHLESRISQQSTSNNTAVDLKGNDMHRSHGSDGHTPVQEGGFNADDTSDCAEIDSLANRVGGKRSAPGPSVGRQMARGSELRKGPSRPLPIWAMFVTKSHLAPLRRLRFGR